MLKYIEKNQGQFSKSNISNIINLDKIYSQQENPNYTGKKWLKIQEKQQMKRKKSRKESPQPKQETQ